MESYRHCESFQRRTNTSSRTCWRIARSRGSGRRSESCHSGRGEGAVKRTSSTRIDGNERRFDKICSSLACTQLSASSRSRRRLPAFLLPIPSATHDSPFCSLSSLIPHSSRFRRRGRSISYQYSLFTHLHRYPFCYRRTHVILFNRPSTVRNRLKYSPSPFSPNRQSPNSFFPPPFRTSRIPFCRLPTSCSRTSTFSSTCTCLSTERSDRSVGSSEDSETCEMGDLGFEL